MEGGMDGGMEGGMEGWREGWMEGWRDGGIDVRYRTFLVLSVFLKLFTHLFMFSPLPFVPKFETPPSFSSLTCSIFLELFSRKA